MTDFIKRRAVLLGFIMVCAGMAGSLYFSEFAGYVPCILCWYQRIVMYPLVAVFAVGLLRKDHSVWAYALPLSLIGTILALYHNFLQWGVISESLAPCAFGVSCVDKEVIALNFVTIPLLSLIAFVLITVLMLLYRRAVRNHE